MNIPYENIDPEIAAALREEHGIDDLPPMEPVLTFVVLILWQAQRDGATNVIVDVANSGNMPIRSRIQGALYELSPFPSHILPQFVQVIMDMAGLAGATEFPCEGKIDKQVSPKVRLQWDVSLVASEGPIHFRRA